MNILARYRKLTFWNKFAFWGSIASISGLILFLIFQPSTATRENQQQLLDESATQLNLQKETIRLLKEMTYLDQTSHEALMQKYPLGYAMFAIKNGDQIITLDKDRLGERFTIDWNEAKIIEINKDKIFMKLPRLIDKASGAALLYNDDKYDREIYTNVLSVGQWVFPRKLGVMGGTIYLGNTEIRSELLVDNNNEIIMVLGFKDHIQNTDGILVSARADFENCIQNITESLYYFVSLYKNNHSSNYVILALPYNDKIIIYGDSNFMKWYDVDWVNAVVLPQPGSLDIQSLLICDDIAKENYEICEMISYTPNTRYMYEKTLHSDLKISIYIIPIQDCGVICILKLI
jgi:hypothetical protein